MEILNFRKSPAEAYEIATFDLDLGPKWGVRLEKMCLMRANTGHYYFQSPKFKTDEMKNGKNVWKPVLLTYGDRGKDFSAAVLNLLQPFIEQMGNMKTESSSEPDFYF